MEDQIAVISDLIVYLSKVTDEDIQKSEMNAKELVINWFDNQERDAMKETNEGDSALKGFKEVTS